MYTLSGEDDRGGVMGGRIGPGYRPNNPPSAASIAQHRLLVAQFGSKGNSQTVPAATASASTFGWETVFIVLAIIGLARHGV